MIYESDRRFLPHKQKATIGPDRAHEKLEFYVGIGFRRLFTGKSVGLPSMPFIENRRVCAFRSKKRLTRLDSNYISKDPPKTNPAFTTASGGRRAQIVPVAKKEKS